MSMSPKRKQLIKILKTVQVGLDGNVLAFPGCQLPIPSNPTKYYQELWYKYCNSVHKHVHDAFIGFCGRYREYDLEALLSKSSTSNKPAIEVDGKFIKNFGKYSLAPKSIKTIYDDPFSYFDRKYKISWDMLRVSYRPVQISTRSDLVSHDDYLEMIPKNSTIRFFKVYKGQKNGSFPSELRIIKAIEKILKRRPDINIYYGKTEMNLLQVNNLLKTA